MADSRLTTLNENHIFESMGLTQTSMDDLNQTFSSELNEFLKTQTFIEKKEDKIPLESAESEIKKHKN